METGARIKAYRLAAHLSQEELAEQIFVTRQTLSNWETGKTYPDINSLLRLGAVFNVSLDELVKGDIQKMKEEIKAEDIRFFKKESNVFTALMIIMVISAVPLLLWDRLYGMIVWLFICGVTMVYAFRVEKLKKLHDIHSYREIVAFNEGKRLDEIQSAVEKGKAPYQKVLLTLLSALLGVLASVVLGWLGGR